MLIYAYLNYREKVELYKELRKLRERPHGTSVVTLALGKKQNIEEEISTNNVI
jgi:hypothetical protein